MTCGNYKPLPLRTGYEQVLPHRVDDIFAVTATDKGTITKLTDSYITIEYTDSIDTHELGIVHGKVSDTYIPHQIVTDLKVGDVVDPHDVITWNSGFFTRDVMNPKSITYKAGAIAHVALFESSDTIEDSSILSAKLALEMSTPKSNMRPIIIEFSDSIHNLVKVGDVVDPDTILCTLESAVTAELIASDPDAVDALRNISASNPKAKYHGRVSKIEIMYHGKIDDMSDNLAELVITDNKARARTAKRLSAAISSTGSVGVDVHIGGDKLITGKAVIQIYIDGSIVMGTGDKVVFASGLKSTVSKIPTDDMVAEDGTLVEAVFGYQSISDRVVLSPEIMGITNRLLVEMSSKMVKIYNGEE